MGENATEKGGAARKRSRVDVLKSEFHKIIWPDKKMLGKQAIAVSIISVLLGVIITIVDTIVKYGIDFIIK